MSQSAKEPGNRRLRLFAKVGPTLLLSLLMILSFTWGGLAAVSEGELSLAQGREPVATTNDNGEVFILWENPQGSLSAQSIDVWGDPRGQEFPIPGLVGGERRPTAAWVNNEQLVIAWESTASPSGAKVQRFGYLTGNNYLVASGEPIEISDALYPAVAVDEAGFVVAWTAQPPAGPNGQHYVAFFDPQPTEVLRTGRLIGNPHRVGTPGALTPPGIAAAEGTGSVLVVWENAGKDIMAAAFLNRVRTGSNFRISTEKQGWNSSPSVTATLDGNFLVVWENEHPNGERYVTGSMVASWGKLTGSNFRISSAPSVAPQRPSLAADPWGRQIVTWSRVDRSGAAAIIAQSMFLDGTRDGPAFRVDSGDPFPGAPRVTRGGPGTDFVVLWEADETSETPDIRIRFLTAPYDLQVDGE